MQAKKHVKFYSTSFLIFNLHGNEMASFWVFCIAIIHLPFHIAQGAKLHERV